MSAFAHDLPAAAARVKSERDERGWSMNRLAQKADVGDGVIARCEAGQTISAPSRKKIADALDLKVRDIWPLVEVPDERAAA